MNVTKLRSGSGPLDILARFINNTTYLCNAYSKSKFLMIHFHKTKLGKDDNLSDKIFYKVKYGNVLVYNRDILAEIYTTIVTENANGKRKILKFNVLLPFMKSISFIITPEGEVIKSLTSNNSESKSDIWKDESGTIDYRVKDEKPTLIRTEEAECVLIPNENIFEESNSSAPLFDGNTTHLVNAYAKSDHLLVHFHKQPLDILKATQEKFYQVKHGDVLVHSRSEVKEHMTVVAEACASSKEVILCSNFILKSNLSYIVTPEGEVKQSLHSHKNHNGLWVSQGDKVDYSCKQLAQQVTPALHITPTTSAPAVQLHVGDIAKLDGTNVYQTKPVNGKERGRLLILNYKNFTEDTWTRHGTEVDAARLRATFERLGFYVSEKQDLSLEQTLKALKEEAKAQENHHRMFVLAILSHGETGGFYCSDIETCNYVDAYSYFDSSKCRILHKKPKIFIIQACQGSNTDNGYEPVMGSNTGNVQLFEQIITEDNSLETFSKDGQIFSRTTPKAKISYKKPNSELPNLVPSTLDRLEIYSSVDGYASYRSKDGSWLITHLCDVLDKHALLPNSTKYDLRKMFEMTKTNVAKEALQKTTLTTKENGETEETVEYVKQLCVINSTLEEKKLIFFD